ncbi:MAG: helix-turn-helix domain-containing protein [Pseudonocardiaceae bacterium]
MPTGQLIRLYRIDRKKTTVNIATHAGITVRYLEMIEAGTKTPSLPVLRKLAKVLGVRTSALVGEPPSEDHEGPVNPRLAEVERAIVTYPSLSLSDTSELPTLQELAEQISAAQKAWYTSPSKYSDVLRTLPDLIVNCERAVHEHRHSVEACRNASELYQLSRQVLKHLGRVDLGGLVSDRAMRYAEETEDPLLIAAATWSLGHSLLSDDRPGGAPRDADSRHRRHPIHRLRLRTAMLMALISERDHTAAGVDPGKQRGRIGGGIVTVRGGTLPGRLGEIELRVRRPPPAAISQPWTAAGPQESPWDTRSPGDTECRAAPPRPHPAAE